MTEATKKAEYKRYRKDLATSNDTKNYLIGVAWAIAQNNSYTAARKGLQLQLLYKAYEDFLQNKEEYDG